MKSRKAQESGSFGTIVAIVIILIVMGAVILFFYVKYQGQASIFNMFSPKDETDQTTCTIACNTDKSLAKGYQSCEIFQNEHFNTADSEFCKACQIKAVCDITFSNVQCLCKDQPLSQPANK